MSSFPAKFQKVIDKFASDSVNNKEFLTGSLAAKAQQAAEVYPHDSTIVTMAQFLVRRASKNTFITRGELTEAYQASYSNSSRFGHIFQSELGIPEKKAEVRQSRNHGEGGNIIADEYARIQETVLGRTIAAALDPTITYRPYTKKASDNAEFNCKFALAELGMEPQAIKTLVGQEDLLLCQATFTTPRGQSHLLFPVEIVGDKALAPTVFLGTEGFLDLTAESLKSHLVKYAGKSYNVDVKTLLSKISDVKNGSRIKPLNEVERIVAQAQLNSAKDAGDMNAVFFTVPAKVEKLGSVRNENPEFDSIAAKFASKAGSAEFIFGKDSVTKARHLVTTKLAKMGYRVETAVDTHNDSTVVFAVSLNRKAGLKVPVKIENGKVSDPAFGLMGGSTVELSRDKIAEMMHQGGDTHLIAKAASLSNQRAPELLEKLAFGLTSKNEELVQETMLALQASNNPEVYQRGLQLCMKVAKGESLVEKSGCCKIIRRANSQHEICSHTNLPTHKVFQDEYGNCRPMYRKNQQLNQSAFHTLNKLIY